MSGNKLDEKLNRAADAIEKSKQEQFIVGVRSHLVMYIVMILFFTGATVLGFYFLNEKKEVLAVVALMGGFWLGCVIFCKYCIGSVGVAGAPLVAAIIYIIAGLAELIHCFATCDHEWVCNCSKTNTCFRYTADFMMPSIWGWKAFFTILLVCMIVGFVGGTIVGIARGELHTIECSNDLIKENGLGLFIGVSAGAMVLSLIVVAVTMGLINHNVPSGRCTF